MVRSCVFRQELCIVRYEAVAGARYLIKCGVDPKRIYIEAASWDTVGNAYFARTIHTDPSGWRRLLVITSESHLPRTEAIFRWVFGVAPECRYCLDFDSTPDRGLAPELLAARKSREAASLPATTLDCRRHSHLAGVAPLAIHRAPGVPSLAPSTGDRLGRGNEAY